MFLTVHLPGEDPPGHASAHGQGPQTTSTPLLPSPVHVLVRSVLAVEDPVAILIAVEEALWWPLLTIRGLLLCRRLLLPDRERVWRGRGQQGVEAVEATELQPIAVRRRVRMLLGEAADPQPSLCLDLLRGT